VVDTTDEAPQHRVKFKALGHSDANGRSPYRSTGFLSGTIQLQTTDKLRPIVEIPWSAMLDPSVRLRSEADHSELSSEPRL